MRGESLWELHTSVERHGPLSGDRASEGPPREKKRLNNVGKSA